MKSIQNRRAIIVGMFIFLGLVFLLGGILTIGNLHNTFVKKINIVSIFDDVNGLQPGNNVWFSGVKVGTVNKIDFFAKSQVRVTMKIDKKSQQYVRRDAKAKISTDGLIGNKIIVIYGGSSKEPAVVEGDTLRMEKVLSTDDIMDTLQANNKNLLQITTAFKNISKKIAAGQGTIGKLLQDETVFDNLNATMASLKKTSANAERLSVSLSDYGDKLHKEGSLANELVTDTAVFSSLRSTAKQLNDVANTASEVTDNLKKATADLDSTNNTVGVLLHDQQTAEDLKSTIRNLDSSSYKLNQNMEALQHTFLLRGYFRKQQNAQQAPPKQ